MPTSEIKAGNRVIIDSCPKYGSACGGHKAKVLGDPVNGIVPIRFNCLGISHSNYPVNRLSKIRSRNMKPSNKAIKVGIILGVILLVGIWLGANYNSLVTARNAVNNSRAKIDTELTRRYDLIDNIVASVEGSQAQESDVFGKIAEARKVGGSTSDPEKQAEANNTIDTQIALLPRLQEAYPELRSNDQVTRLIQELQGTNNTIRDKRNDYNDTVTNYNNNISSFPKNIFAGLFNFDQAKLFEASSQERVNPKVEFKRNAD